MMLIKNPRTYVYGKDSALQSGACSKWNHVYWLIVTHPGALTDLLCWPGKEHQLWKNGPESDHNNQKQ